jgi:hypothetical protein
MRLDGVVRWWLRGKGRSEAEVMAKKRNEGAKSDPFTQIPNKSGSNAAAPQHPSRVRLPLFSLPSCLWSHSFALAWPAWAE